MTTDASERDEGVSQRERLQPLLERHRATRTGDLELDVTFSWPRTLISVFSYALLLSDVLRTGLGMRTSPYANFEPDRGFYYGPYVYPVTHILRNETSSTQDVWAYKFDSTSISMRAVAEHLAIDQWPPCVLYKTQCGTNTLQRLTIFNMIDSLVSAVAKHKSARARPNLTLRTKSVWIDRLHHFILPWFFDSTLTQTNQAIYYDAATLTTPGFQFCYGNQAWPYACLDIWHNLARVCSTVRCQQVGRVFSHIATRVSTLRKRYAGTTLDLVIVEGSRDHSKPGPSLQGRKFFDVTAFTRVRDCSSSSTSTNSTGACTTVAVDDYRYEGGLITTDVSDAYVGIAILRGLGQAYMWLRVLLLVVGCYRARVAERKFADANFPTRVFAALRTLFLIPSQVVVYGSVVPIVCYVTAHMLDSAIAYELATQRFVTQLGAFALDPRDFVFLSAVSMRSVWVLSFLLHVALSACRPRRWPRASGVPGISEFIITSLACITVLAQFRSLDLRNVRVLSTNEVVPSARVAAVRASAYSSAYSVWGRAQLGSTQDVKCLLASVAVFALLLLGVHYCLRVVGACRAFKRIQVVVWSRSQVSYAAGTLWPTSALVVSWNGLFVVRKQPSRAKRGPSRAAKRTQLTHGQAQVAPTLLTGFAGSASSAEASSLSSQTVTPLPQRYKTLSAPPPPPPPPPRASQVAPTVSLALVSPAAMSKGNAVVKRKQSSWSSLMVSNGGDRSSHSARQRLCLTVPDERNREAESMIYLMNLAAMTDPIVLLRLYWPGGGGKAIGVYESRATQRLFLLPQAARPSPSSADDDVWADYSLLAEVHTRDLSWPDLLQCG